MSISSPDYFGPLFSRSTLALAVIAQLQNPPAPQCDAGRLIYYLAEVERQTGVAPRTYSPPPGPTSYRHLQPDSDAWTEDVLPIIHVVVQPTGAPQRYDEGVYSQVFRIEVSATTVGNYPEEALLSADAYGAAIAGSILQKGSLGLSNVVKTDLLDYPLTTWVDRDMRRIARSTAAFQTRVMPVFIERIGPMVWPTDPYSVPGPYSITEVNVDLIATGSSSIATVTEP